MSSTSRVVRTETLLTLRPKGGSPAVVSPRITHCAARAKAGCVTAMTTWCVAGKAPWPSPEYRRPSTEEDLTNAADFV